MRHRAARDGAHIEQIGTYNPLPDDRGFKHIELNLDRIKYWLAVGAETTDRVAWLFYKVNYPISLSRTSLLCLSLFLPLTLSIES